MPVVASIGCTEPWNAAGLGLDIRALAACGARPVTVVAGVTAQDAGGVSAAVAIEARILTAQLEALRGAGIAAYRIGALLDRATLDVVVGHVREARVPVVYDPVFAPTGTGRFADAGLVAAIAATLVPLVTLVTPNLSEAALLTGGAVNELDAMERAALALVASGAGAALVKGGHLADTAVDVLCDGLGVVAFEAPRIPGTLRGTGCLLACGIAAELARGTPLRDAVATGRAFVRERFERAVLTGGMHVAY